LIVLFAAGFLLGALLVIAVGINAEDKAAIKRLDGFDSAARRRPRVPVSWCAPVVRGRFSAMARGQFPVTSGAKTLKRRPQKFDSGKPVAARTATGETAGGQMADVVLIELWFVFFRRRFRGPASSSLSCRRTLEKP